MLRPDVLSPRLFSLLHQEPLPSAVWSNDHLYPHSNDDVRVVQYSEKARKALAQIREKPEGVVIIVGGGLDSGFRHFLSTAPVSDDERILLITEINPVQLETMIDWKLQLIRQNPTVFGYLAEAFPIGNEFSSILKELEKAIIQHWTSERIFAFFKERILSNAIEYKSVLISLLIEMFEAQSEETISHLFKFAVFLMLTALTNVDDSWSKEFVDNLSHLPFSKEKVRIIQKVFQEHPQLKLLLKKPKNGESKKKYVLDLTGRVDDPIYNLKSELSSELTDCVNSSHWLLPKNYEKIREAIVSERVLRCSVPIQLIMDSGVSVLWESVPLLSIHASNAPQYFHDDDTLHLAREVREQERIQGSPVLMVAADCDYETRVLARTPSELLELETREEWAKDKWRFDKDRRSKLT